MVLLWMLLQLGKRLMSIPQNIDDLEYHNDQIGTAAIAGRKLYIIAICLDRELDINLVTGA